jgi:glutaredoxin
MGNNELKKVITTKMANGEYELKPCPFCGGKPKMMSQKFFEELVEDNGRALISIDCQNCDLSLHDHTSDENDYFIRAFLIAEKWNRRIK